MNPLVAIVCVVAYVRVCVRACVPGWVCYCERTN